MSVEIPAGEVTFSGNVVTVKSGWVSDNTFEVDTAGGTDLSFVTAGANQILAGYTGSDKDGNQITGNIQKRSSDDVWCNQGAGSIEIAEGYYSEMLVKQFPEGDVTVDGNVVKISPGWVPEGEIAFEESGYDTSDATAIAGFVMEGYTFYGIDGKETGTLKALSTSDMVIMEDALLGIPHSRYSDNATYSLKNVHGIGDLSPENIVKGKTIAGIEGSHECPENSGSSMEIYKCVDAEGLTWWIVSGCGTPEANGRYYQGAEVFDTYNMTFVRPFYQKDGSCSIEYKDGCWKVFSGGTVLYRDESWSYYDGDPSQCTGWVVESGVEPVPTITKETTTGNEWKGKKYDTETGEVADTVTDLTFPYIPPQIGKFYTADGVILCEFPMITDYLYHPSVTEIGDLSVWGTQPTFGTWKGVPCMIFDGTGAFYKFFDSLINRDFTFSSFWYMLESSSQAIASIGTWNPYRNMEILYNGSDIKFYSWNTYSNEKFLNGNYFNSWHTMTVTYSASSRTFIMYLDGEQIGSRSGTPNLDPKIAIGTNITKDGTNPRDGYMTGYIGDVSIWSRVLTAEEIFLKHKQMMALVTE